MDQYNPKTDSADRVLLEDEQVGRGTLGNGPQPGNAEGLAGRARPGDPGVGQGEAGLDEQLELAV